MEKIDIYDSNYVKTGKVKYRNDKLNKDEFRIVIHACIFNNEGKMLIQRRSTKKSSWPGLWDITCGGQVKAGETCQDALKRELFEELGINIKCDNTRPSISFHFNEGLDNVYFINGDINLNELKFNDGEVIAAKYVTCDELMDMYYKGEFVKYHESIIKMFFEYRTNNNAYLD